MIRLSFPALSGALARCEINDRFLSVEVELTSLGVSKAFGDCKTLSSCQDESVPEIEVFGTGAAYSVSKWTCR